MGESKSFVLMQQEVAIFKAMSPAEKLVLAARFYNDARKLKRAGLKSQHPDWSEEQIEGNYSADGSVR